MELPQLVELLADKTARYAEMRSMACSQEEFKEIQQELLILQVEIEHRKMQAGNNTTITAPDIFFER